MNQINYSPDQQVYQGAEGSVIVDTLPKKPFLRRILSGKIKYLIIFLILLLLVGIILLVLRFTIWRQPEQEIFKPDALSQTYSEVFSEADKIFENQESEDNFATASQYFEDALKSATTPEARFIIERARINSFSKHGYNGIAINYATNLEATYQFDEERLCEVYGLLIYLFYKDNNLEQQQSYVDKMQATCPQPEGGVG